MKINLLIVAILIISVGLGCSIGRMNARSERQPTIHKKETVRDKSKQTSGKGDADETEEMDADENETAATSADDEVPSEIVGTWQTGKVSDTVFTNSSTGASDNGSSIQVMYKIFADGTYEYASLESHRMYNCKTDLSLYKTGIVSIAGNSLTFQPQDGKFTSEDSCNAQYNYEKPATLETENYQWRVESDESGLKICLKNASVNGCAYKRE